MFNRKKKGQLGFTLIELLAVVAILGILAGVAVPRVMGALATARTRANEANITILQSAVERWVMDNSLAATNITLWGPIATNPTVGSQSSMVEAGLAAHIGSVPAAPAGFYPYVILFTQPGGAGTIIVATVRNSLP